MNRRMLKFQMDALTSGMLLWLGISSLAGIFTFLVLRGFVPLNWLSVWLGALVVANAIRAAVALKYRSSERNQDFLEIRAFFRGSTILSAAVWASLSLLVIGKLPPELDTIFTAVMLAVLLSMVVSNVADKLVAASITLIITLPFAFKIYFEQQTYYLLFILLNLTYLFFSFSIINRFNQTLFNNFDLAAEKEKLLEEVTKKFKLEKELKEEKLKSLQASKFAAIGEMAAGVGHEINNPLTIVLGYHWKLSRLIKEKNPDPEILKIVEKSAAACNRIAEIVKSMRDFSRMRRVDELEEFKLSSVVKVVKPLIRKNLDNSEVELQEDVEDCAAVGLPGEFAQVLYNLIHNAIQACEELPGKHVVKLTGGKEFEEAFFSVANPGPAIAEEVQEKMFQPFFTTKGVGKGTGLGLSLAKTIMENNHGSISYKYAEGENVFTMKMALPNRGRDQNPNG